MRTLYILLTFLDPAGGTSYSIVGTSQLLSVPYSLYARTAGNGSLWSQSGSDIYYNSGKVGVGTNTPKGLLDIIGNSAVHLPQLSLTESENDFARLIFKSGPYAPYQSHWSVEGRVDEGIPENSKFNFSYYNGWVEEGMTMT